MNKEEMKGKIKEAKGKFKEVAGKILDNEQMEREGNIKKNAGKTQADAASIKAEITKRN